MKRVIETDCVVTDSEDAMRIGSLDSDVVRLRDVYFIAFGLALMGVSVGAWWLAGRALRPVVALTRTTEQVTAEGLDQRIAEQSHDREFNRLITVFNEMMDRLEKSFAQASRFSADASHELKTPLTIMQGEIERALELTSTHSDQQRVFVQLLEEVQRLKGISNKLLLLSRADAGQLQISAVSVNLSEMAEELAEDAVIMAFELKVHTEIAPGIHVQADPELLAHVLRNLLSNAVKYNIEEGWVLLELMLKRKTVEFRVSNSSLGIADEERERIFERFHRADSSRRCKVEGMGLGLGLARVIARAHGGGLKLLRSDPNIVIFGVSLPS
ncbi:ATP-binding protein [bacterium]|jgi:two-component system, OmpR family, heavy metal sensor histidine kinase CusS|nr:ATP-binding protein [bacterium]